MIRFTDKQWDQVRENYRKWWKNELGRPILPMILWGADSGRAMPTNPLLSCGNCNDFCITPEQIIDRYDYELSSYEYYGDSFPIMPMTQFGPGVTAAFLGAGLHNDNNTVWFHPEKNVPISELHLEYQEDNLWLNRVKGIYRAGMEKWGGNVAMGMVDLGGVLDILASFLTTENLIFALCDEPEEVRRLVKEITGLWLRFHGEICEILKGQQGYTDWSSIFSEEPSYMLQSDFCYMIGQDMFDQFVRPELCVTSSHLHNAFYHLDGIGELKHLGRLLTLDSVKGIQWVPGEGDPVKQDWSEVYRKISGAGRKMQCYYNFESYLDEVLAVIDRPDDLVKMQFGYPITQKGEALRKLAKYCE